MSEIDLFSLDKKVLFKEGELATDLHLVKNGHVLCLKKFNDRLIPVLLAKSTDIVGESAMLEDKAYHYSAIAFGETETIAISKSQFAEAFKQAPEWITQLSELMVQRYSLTCSLIAENRVLSPLIISDEEFTAEIEVELKKLIN